jgi:hypothetical protein
MLGEPHAACGLQCRNTKEQWLSFGAWRSSIPWPLEAHETLAAIHEVFGDWSRSEYRLVHRGRLWSLGPMTDGWLIPLPSRPVKSDEDLRREREAKIGELERRGLLRSERLRRAMLTVRREDFIPPGYRDHAYEEIPLPLPGERATISCPHSYPLFYEPLGLDEGHRFLEVGVGSGYGTSLAREVVGREGLVVAIDIDATTLAFARENLDRAAYTDVVLIHGDGRSRGPRARPLRPDLRHGGLPRCPAATDRAARRARPADRAHHRRYAPTTDPPREDRGRPLAQEPRGRVVRLAAGTVRRRQRSAQLSRDNKQPPAETTASKRERSPSGSTSSGWPGWSRRSPPATCGRAGGAHSSGHGSRGAGLTPTLAGHAGVSSTPLASGSRPPA